MPNSKCRKCGRPIVFLKHKDTGKVNPIEVEKVVEGNIVVDLSRGLYRIANGDEYGKAKIKGIKLHISHFARCPNAASFRK